MHTYLVQTDVCLTFERMVVAENPTEAIKQVESEIREKKYSDPTCVSEEGSSADVID